MKLKELGEYYIGLTYKPEQVSERGVIVLRSGNIQDGQFDLSDIVRVDARIREKLFVKPGDILMCSRNGSARLVGKSVVIPAINEPMSFGAFMTIFRTQYNEYLKFFLQSNCFRRQLSGSKTTTINQITIRMLDNIDIDLPEENERKERVRRLEFLQHIVDLRKKELDSLNMLIKARFIDMFGNPVANEKSWTTVSLDDACDGIGDGLHGTPEYDDNGEYPFINGNNLVDGMIVITPATKMVNEATYRKHYIEITDNAILISINGTLGKIAFYKGEKVMLGKSACYCNFKPSINREFVYGVMKSDAFTEFLESNSTKSTIKNVGLKAIRGFQLIIPPDELQLQFVEFSRQVDKSKAAVQKSLDEAQLLYDSLMQQYFG